MARKELISADGTPYTVWQRRTRVLCLIYFVWALVEVGVGAGFIAVRQGGIFDIAEHLSVITLGESTIISGFVSLVIALSGLWGAHNPKRITLFFWVTLLSAVLYSWYVASAWSTGQLDPVMVASLAITLIYAACAWNVRGQTGYFDNHPKPEDPDEFPLQRDARVWKETVEQKEEELASAKQQLEEMRAQLDNAKDRIEDLKQK